MGTGLGQLPLGYQHQQTTTSLASQLLEIEQRRSMSRLLEPSLLAIAGSNSLGFVQSVKAWDSASALLLSSPLAVPPWLRSGLPPQPLSASLPQNSGLEEDGDDDDDIYG